MGLSLKSIVKPFTNTVRSIENAVAKVPVVGPIAAPIINAAAVTSGFGVGATTGATIASGNMPTTRNIVLDAAGLGAGAAVASSGIIAGSAVGAGGVAASGALMPPAVAEAGAVGTAAAGTAAAGGTLATISALGQKALSAFVAKSGGATPNNVAARGAMNRANAPTTSQGGNNVPLYVAGAVVALLFLVLLFRRLR